MLLGEHVKLLREHMKGIALFLTLNNLLVELE